MRVRESTAAGGCPGQAQPATDLDGADDRGGPELRTDEVQPVVVVRAQRREVGARVAAGVDVAPAVAVLALLHRQHAHGAGVDVPGPEDGVTGVLGQVGAISGRLRVAACSGRWLLAARLHRCGHEVSFVSFGRGSLQGCPGSDKTYGPATPSRTSCQHSATTRAAMISPARRLGASRHHQLAGPSGAMMNAAAVARTTGAVRAAASHSPEPTCIAAVVPPHIGHGIPVSVRNGHTRSGRRRCSAARTTAAVASARKRTVVSTRGRRTGRAGRSGRRAG